ncbi:hypothetical protein LguiA_002005 [Lonicera macranthoides]
MAGQTHMLFYMSQKWVLLTLKYTELEEILVAESNAEDSLCTFSQVLADNDDDDKRGECSYARPSFARRPLKKTKKVKLPILMLGGNTFVAREKTNLKDQCNLVPLEGDQEIFEEDAVCEICFNAFKLNEEMVKMKCKCKSEELVHEACATINNCGVCKHQVEKIHLILLQLPTDAGVTTHNNWKKKLKCRDSTGLGPFLGWEQAWTHQFVQIQLLYGYGGNSTNGRSQREFVTCSSARPSFARRLRMVKDSIPRPLIPRGNPFVARQRTNLKDQDNLVPLEGDQEIIGEDAVCEICFKAFNVNEEMVKMKCQCKCKSEELVHEACATKSNCGVCKQQVEKIHLILLQLPTDAGVTTHKNWKKKFKCAKKIHGARRKSWKELAMLKDRFVSFCRSFLLADSIDDHDDHDDYNRIYLLEATARIENPVRGCTALLASFEQKVEELQARVTALEARLGGGSSCVNPLCSFAPPGDSSRFFSSVENNVPNVIPTAVNLSEPIAGGFLRLLMSKEGVQNILSTSTNLVENGAPLTEVDLPSFPNRSYDQATLDAVYQGASNSFLSQSALDDFVVDFAETTGLDWTASGNIHHDFSDYSSSDLSTILNFGADDLQILQPFLND